MTEFKCDFCKKVSTKPLCEFERNTKLNRKNYCSRVCVGKDNFLKNIGDKAFRTTEHLKNLKRTDEFSEFRQFLRRAKNRKHDVNISLQYLKQLWEKQNKICTYSRIQLILPSSKGRNNSIITASLDRIDNSKGYIEGNVQFISTAINYMKHTMSHEETIKLIQLIINNY